MKMPLYTVRKLCAVAGLPQRTNRKAGTLFTGLTACLLLSVTTAQAQSAGVVEEIVVTAEKREQNVQDVPIAISAFSADMLEARGISSPDDLQHAVPGLAFSTSSGGGYGSVSLRGVGASSGYGRGEPGGHPGVPVHVNGIYLQSAAFLLRDFLDVERVEVLRGPQGTLYGRNATGGNINVITGRPGSEVEGEVGIDIGNYDKRRIHGVLSGPLTERLRGRVAFATEDRDGYVENVVDNADDELLNSDYSHVRATVEFDLTEDILVTLSGFHYDADGSNFVARLDSLPAGGPGSIYAAVPGTYINVTSRDLGKVQNDTRGGGSDKAKGVYGDITWDLGNMTFRSLTSYIDMDLDLLWDLDGTNVAAIQSEINFTTSYETLTQEFQLFSNDESKLQWLVGVFYYNEESFRRANGNIGTTTTISYDPAGTVDAESIAVFGQVDYRFTEQLSLTAGLRYTRDDMEVTRTRFVAIALPPPFGDGVTQIPFFNEVAIPADDSWDELTWKIGLNYDLNEDVMMYFTYSTGYRSGGFNLEEPTQAPFDPETVDAFEAGIKSRWFDDRVQLNMAGYYYDYSDKQESVFTPAGAILIPTVENAASATIAGMELELLAHISDAFSLDASLGYIDSEYDEYMSADAANPFLGVQDLSGNRLPDAPEWQFHIGAQYALALGRDMGTLTARVDYSWTDDKYGRAFNYPTDRLNSYDRSNARLMWESNSGAWMAELYVRNIENDDTANSFNLAGPQQEFIRLNAYLPPRTYGLKLRYRF